VVLTILKNMKVNGKDYPRYEMENVPNHQPVVDYHLFGGIQVLFDYPKIIWDLTSLQEIIRNIILNHSPVGCHFDHFSMLHREASQLDVHSRS